MEIRPADTALVHYDKRTDLKLTGSFRDYATALKKTPSLCHSSCQITEYFYPWLATLDHECKLSPFKMRGKILSFFPPVQDGLGAHNEYRISLSSLAVDHPPHSSAEVIPLFLHTFSSCGGTTSSPWTCSEHWTDNP